MFTCVQMSGAGRVVVATCLALCFSHVDAVFASGNTEPCRSYIVLSDAPVLAYSGGTPGYSATKVPSLLAFDCKAPTVTRYRKYLHDRQEALAKRVAQIDPRFKVRGQFSHLVNAILCDLDPGSVEIVRSLPGVVAVVSERRYHPQMETSNRLMNVPLAWESLGGDAAAGRGIRIAIIDTGVDVTHPVFSGEGFDYPDGFPRGDTEYTNPKVIVARVYPNELTGDDVTPQDRDGHGTHVASCAGGNLNVETPNGAISGVAPGAWIGNYNIFNSEEANDEQLLQALEDAALDGMDVINLSLGSDETEESAFHPVLMAIRNLTASGVVVVASAGNAGHGGETATVGFPGQAQEAITVGSVANERTQNSFVDAHTLDFSFARDGAVILEDSLGSLIVSGDPLLHPLRGDFPLVSADLLHDGLFGEPLDASATVPLGENTAENAWVLVSYGDDVPATMVEQIQNLEHAGAVGAFVFPLGDEDVAPSWLKGTSIPVFRLDRATGLDVFSLFAADGAADGANSGAVTATGRGIARDVRTVVPFIPSTFTTQGPGPRGAVKPEIVAVGQYSYAAFQDDFPGGGPTGNRFDVSGFAFGNGTSFAAPRVAGAAALVRQRHPGWRPDHIRSALIGGAVLEDGLSQASVNLRGAGHVDVNGAMTAELLVHPPILSFGIDDSGMEERRYHRTLTVEPTQDEAIDVVLTGEGERLNDWATLDISPTAFRLEPSAAVTVDVTLTVQTPVAGERQEIEGSLRFAWADGQRQTDVHFFQRTHGSALPAPETRVVLVDDDGGGMHDQVVFEDLEQTGHSVFSWDVHGLGRFPTGSVLRGADLVFWYLGPYSLARPYGTDAVPNDAELIALNRMRMDWYDTLLAYLDSGGSLFLVGQDYTDVPSVESTEEDPYEFTKNILQLPELMTDVPIDSVQSVAGGRLELDLDATDLFPPFNLNVDEMILDTELGDVVAELVDPWGTDSVVAYSLQNSRYRVVFFAFPILGLEDVELRRGVVSKSVAWLVANTPVSFAVTGVEPIGVEPYPGGFDLRILGTGYATPGNWQIQVGSQRLSGVTRENDEELNGTLETSPLPGVYDVIVTTPGGVTASLPDGLTITEDGPTSYDAWALHGISRGEE